MRPVLAAVVLLASTAACTGGSVDAPPPTPLPTPTTTAVASRACTLLDGAERRALTGAPVDRVLVVDGGVPDAQCRWEGDATAYVEVSSLDAAVWAGALPGLVASLRDSDRPLDDGQRRTLDAVAALVEAQGAGITADEACAIFPRLGAVAGGDGSDVLVTYVRQPEGATGVQAQTCTEGRFTSVVYAAAGVRESAVTTAAARRAVGRAHERALAYSDTSARRSS